ncbi:MAG TPA: hypothetical protein VF763_09065 [Candidatus Limnocylindrales bacterium]
MHDVTVAGSRLGGAGGADVSAGRHKARESKRPKEPSVSTRLPLATFDVISVVDDGRWIDGPGDLAITRRLDRCQSKDRSPVRCRRLGPFGQDGM